MRVTMKQARIASANKTQTQMAAVLGMTEKTYRGYEQNPGRMTYDMAVAFAEAAGVDVSDIDWSRR